MLWCMQPVIEIRREEEQSILVRKADRESKLHSKLFCRSAAHCAVHHTPDATNVYSTHCSHTMSSLSSTYSLVLLPNFIMSCTCPHTPFTHCSRTDTAGVLHSCNFMSSHCTGSMA